MHEEDEIRPDGGPLKADMAEYIAGYEKRKGTLDAAKERLSQAASDLSKATSAARSVLDLASVTQLLVIPVDTEVRKALGEGFERLIKATRDWSEAQLAKVDAHNDLVAYHADNCPLCAAKRG